MTLYENQATFKLNVKIKIKEKMSQIWNPAASFCTKLFYSGAQQATPAHI